MLLSFITKDVRKKGFKEQAFQTGRLEKSSVQESCAFRLQRAIKYTEIVLQLPCRSQLSANLLG